MNMKVDCAGGGTLQQLDNVEAQANIGQALEKIKSGDMEGAKAELRQAIDALKNAGADAPGQKLDMEELLRQLREILEQGKKQSAESPANQAGQGGQKNNMDPQLLQLIVQLLQQMGAPEAKSA
ncbi:hypothetical protein [Ramlibacter tataouinensis]|uniref:Uncharacterized protein n=1 Tax=Ramlibacter tataouinensis (strain ATCC BAA-407 / DSM 14655 / LMG 21543 / TTB310) TaxID=365046 RepID=F5XVY9_RAMTT|nr:hypothetical protein [Ramlibacter tataouinensis]AEG94092.1 hypothetical protein Rta_29880 [Ramlibacter tataouinensis TTB310]